MGTVPVIRVKGMSRLQYTFEWDKGSRHYAYEPKNQREADDIFRTQGKLYKRMFFSVLMEDKKKEEPVKKKAIKKKKAVVEKEPDHHFEKEPSTIEGSIRQTLDKPLVKKPELQAVVQKEEE